MTKAQYMNLKEHDKILIVDYDENYNNSFFKEAVKDSNFKLIAELLHKSGNYSENSELYISCKNKKGQEMEQYISAKHARPLNINPINYNDTYIMEG